MNIVVRMADIRDFNDIYDLHKGIAEMEYRLTGKDMQKGFTITTEQMRNRLFPKEGLPISYYACVAENKDTGEKVGFAFYYSKVVSTHRNEQVLWIEDFFVKEEYRNKRIGSRILLYLAELSLSSDVQFQTMEWTTRPNNMGSQRLYRDHLGVTVSSEPNSSGWLEFKVESAKLKEALINRLK